MNSRIVRLLPLSLMLLLPFAAHSATLFVSHDGSGTDGLSWETAFPTVHAAMLTASSGDHVWVRSATYAGDIRMATGVSMFGGFAGTEGSNEFHLRDWKINPTVLSGGGPVIECSDNTLLDGFIVQNGISVFPVGGGIFVYTATCTIQNCNIYRNRIAGIKCLNASVDIYNCIVRENDRGGIDITDSVVSIKDCTVTLNSALEGAGLEVRRSSLDMRDSRIIENRAENDSGTGARGGGIYSSSSRLVLDRCVIARNVAKGAIVPFGGGSDGGAIYSLSNVDATLTNCLIEGNVALRGNVFSIGQDSVYKLDSCTVTSNDEMDIDRANELWVSNSILFPKGEVVISGTSRRYFSYSNIKGGVSGEGNIDADPMFVDPENGDFRLMQGSPCIDSGTDTGLAHDLDGNPRPIGRYDMGAYEFPFLRSDINGDGVVDALDLLIFSEDWKKVSGP